MLDTRPHVVQMVGSGVWRPHQPCSADLLKRIVAGVCRSRLRPREYKRIFQFP
jgi:hypothetical protein